MQSLEHIFDKNLRQFRANLAQYEKTDQAVAAEREKILENERYLTSRIEPENPKEPKGFFRRLINYVYNLYYSRQLRILRDSENYRVFIASLNPKKPATRKVDIRVNTPPQYR